MPAILVGMPPDELEDLMNELRSWADQARHGEQKELAEMLGVSRQVVNNWITGRNYPGIREGLKLQAFLRNWRKKSTKQKP